MGATIARGGEPQTQGARFRDDHAELLLELLRTDTVSPMELGRPSTIAAAQELYAGHARTLGFHVELHAAPPPSVLEAPLVPLKVRERAAEMGELFLASQPSLVLRLGPGRARGETLMLNAHVDTVGGEVPVTFDGERFGGRGAVDMKGPAVALLAGLEAARAARPSWPERTTVLVQLVAGEEGGAMGGYGTRWLVRAGFVGRLNVFAEPTEGRWFDACTAAMTARVAVDGVGSTDDARDAGDNATLLLGFVAAELAAELDHVVDAAGGKLCVAGLCTGREHDRLYGEGELLLNLVYPSASVGQQLGCALEHAFDRVLGRFERRFTATRVGRRTARRAASTCTLRWLKRGLPTLENRDPAIEPRLRALGLERLPDERSRERFTCDAIWCSPPRSYTIVLGPGSLRDDGAHAAHEHVALSALEHYARTVERLALAFDDWAAGA